MKYIKIFLICLLAPATLVSCFDDNDDTVFQASDLTINNFIYRGMNTFYLYKADTPELANDAFETQEELDTYLGSFADPQDLFHNGLVSNVDRFSFLVDDYIALEQEFSGITLNNGMRFGLVLYPNNPNNVFGYVRYIVPNSPAANTNLERGVIFNAIDGTQITTDNFRDLLAPDTYTISVAEFDGETVTPTDETVTMTKVELTENPVHIARTLNVNGENIGYLMYNAFTADFDTSLNSAFAQFQADGISDLVLDLRYNGGGSVRSAIDLCSMITGQFGNDIITTEEWNAEIQASFLENDPARLENRFNTELRTGEAINSLNLTRVYVLTSSRTASASEFVINGLNPYIDLIQIGENTTGKYQASITLYDSENFRRQDANPNHTYAIQPLVLKEVNSVGFTDFDNGLQADIGLSEDFSNLGELGDPNEPLLSVALNDAVNFTGELPENRFERYRNTIQLEVIGEDGMQSPLYQEMYLDDEKPDFVNQ